METNQQNTPQICWNRVTVTELKFTKNQWRTDRLLWKGTQGYGGDDWGDWEQWAQCSYQGQPHSSHQQPPDMILYGGSYLRWWNGREEKVQSTADPKNGQFRHMSGPRQTSHVHIGYTHTHKWTNTTTVRDAICQSQRRISATLSQHWHNPKSTWLKLDLSNSTQTVSVNSDSFRPDWRDIVTLVIVAASLWQVCAHSHTLTHRHTIFVVKSEC